MAAEDIEMNEQTTDNDQGKSPNATGGNKAKPVEVRTGGLFDASIDMYDSHNGIAHILPSKGQATKAQ